MTDLESTVVGHSSYMWIGQWTWTMLGVRDCIGVQYCLFWTEAIVSVRRPLPQPDLIEHLYKSRVFWVGRGLEFYWIMQMRSKGDGS